MVNVNVSKVINRPMADVFAFVANFENHPRWETDFLEVKSIDAMVVWVRPTNVC